MRVCNTIIANFVLVILLLWITFCFFYPEQIPTFTFTAITAGFAYQAYRYTKEKFRLDLFEKRWEMYENVMSFHAIFNRNKGLAIKSNNQEEIENVIRVAYGSFRGIGWHKTQLLFGDDIHMFFEGIERIYSKYISMDGDHEAAIVLFGTTEEKFSRIKDMNVIEEGLNNLPKIFAPYLYFGDYKSNMEQEKNLCALCASAVKTTIQKFKPVQN